MIDTVIIKVPMDQLLPNVRCDGRTEWQGWNVRMGNNFCTYIHNPHPAQIVAGNYYPRLTGYRDKGYGWKSMVKIEFSVPKLLWGNNLDELENCNFLPVINTLQNRLMEFSFEPIREALIRAKVISLHYSKNFLLNGGYTSQSVILDIKRIHLSGRLIKTTREYVNSGLCVNLHNKSFALSIYDKISELDAETSNLLDRVIGVPEVLRIEARLENLRKINHVFGKLELGNDPVFSEVFDSEKSRQVVTFYWKELIASQLVLVSQTNETANDILQKLLRLIPDLKPHRALKLTALVQAGRSPGGLSELRSILTSYMNQRSWYRLHTEIKEVSNVMEETEENWWEQIETQLAEYEALSLIAC